MIGTTAHVKDILSSFTKTQQQGILKENGKFTPTTSHSLIYADTNTSLTEACEIISKNSISSLPILHPSSNAFIGMIDIADICLYIVHTYSSLRKGNGVHGGNDDIAALLRDVRVGELFCSLSEGGEGVGMRNECWKFSPEDGIGGILEAFSKGVHRALITMSEGGHNTYTMLSQIDVVFYLFNSHQYDDILNKKLHDLPALFAYHQKLVVIDGETPALEGFKQIGREHFGAVAVVNSAGCVTASLCGSDLSNLGANSDLISDLLLPTNQFLRRVHDGKIPTPLTTSDDDTLGEVVARLIGRREHHTWVVDRQGQLKGVLTLSDICKVFISKPVLDAQI